MNWYFRNLLQKVLSICNISEEGIYSSKEVQHTGKIFTFVVKFLRNRSRRYRSSRKRRLHRSLKGLRKAYLARQHPWYFIKICQMVCPSWVKFCICVLFVLHIGTLKSEKLESTNKFYLFFWLGEKFESMKKNFEGWMIEGRPVVFCEKGFWKVSQKSREA